MNEVAYNSWITWETGPHCPTSQNLLASILERSTVDPESFLALGGLWQFGPVESPQNEQMERAHEFWSSYVGDCSNCGGYVHDGNRQPKCGHIYCDLCKMRGRDDDCAYGVCEDAPVMSAKSS